MATFKHTRVLLQVFFHVHTSPSIDLGVERIHRLMSLFSHDASHTEVPSPLMFLYGRSAFSFQLVILLEGNSLHDLKRCKADGSMHSDQFDSIYCFSQIKIYG